MSILIKDMEMPESCDGCKLKSCGYCDITNRLVPYDGSRHGDCPLVEVPDEQPDRNAQERYEDLCEYFKDCHDKGIGILGDRKEFKAWLERVHWHVVRCDELGRELEKLKSAQPEKRTDKRTETHACDSISRQAAIDVARDWYEGLICGSFKGLEKRLRALPSAQPDIIRCEDCKWYGRADKRRFYRGMDCLQKRIDTIVPDKDFCSKAERRADEQTVSE